MDYRIDFRAIEESYGCDNCKHVDDGRWNDYCAGCNPDYYPPSQYRPARGSIQEKKYYDQLDRITYSDYLRFLQTGK